jgi:hypothetical protein
MDWWVIALVVVVAFFGWRSSKNKEKGQAARETLDRDNRLYQHIKAGMREVNWREQKESYRRRRDGEMIFEDAHMRAYHVEHFAETRVGFYFKDLNEYGLYGFFAGNDDDVYHSYYRSDETFKLEGRLLHDDD